MFFPRLYSFYIQGSGKSTFSSLLESIGLVIISQDQLGTRFKCERKIVRALLEGKDVVVDRCNFDTTQRKHWLDYGNAAGATIGVVVFGTPIETCIKRVDSRKGHRTLRPGPQSATVIRRMATDFVFPTRKEGFVFCRVIRTDQDGQRVSNEVFEWFSSP